MLPSVGMPAASASFATSGLSLTCANSTPSLGLTGLFWVSGASQGLSLGYGLPLEAQVVATLAQFRAYAFSYIQVHTAHTHPLAVGHMTPFSSPEWLVGVSSSRPGRPFNATADLLNFANGGVGLAFSPWGSVPVLFNWFHTWSVSAARAGAPTYKL